MGGPKTLSPQTWQGHFSRIIIFAMIGLLLLQGTSLAQSNVKIAGTIRDETDGRPLPAAHVQVDGLAIGAVTNAFGYYTLEDLPAGDYRLRVSHVGYQTRISPLLHVQDDPVTRWNGTLQPDFRQAEDVVIVARRWDDVTADPTAEVIRVTADDIARSGATTVGEALRAVPGVYVREYGGAGGQMYVSIRGSDTDEVLVLLDGVRLNPAHLSAADLSRIPVSIVERIDIVKGGNAARYGAGAVGGVIHIITKSGSAVAEPRLTARSTLGSFQRRDAGLSHTATWGAATILAAWDRTDVRGDFRYTDPATNAERRRRNNDLLSHHLFTKYSRNTSRSNLQLSAQFTGTDRGLPGFVPNVTPTAVSRDRQWIVSGRLQRQTAATLVVDAQVGFQYVQDDDRNDLDPDTPTSAIPYDTRTRSRSLDIEVGADWQQSMRHRVRSGYRYRRDTIDGIDRLRPRFSIGAKSRPLHAVFTQYEYRQSLPGLWDHIVLAASARYEHSDRTTSQFGPKIGVSVSRDDFFLSRLRANIGRSWRLPDFYDLYFEGFRSRGNPDLRPERGVDIDAGGAISRYGWDAQVSWFRNRRTDVIQWRQTFDGTFTPVNVPRAHIDGAEFTLSWAAPGESFSISANHVITQAINKTGERNTDGKWLTNRPRRVTNLQARMGWRALFGEVRQRIVGKRFVTEANTISVPGYQILDLTIGGHMALTPHLNLISRLSFRNLQDKRYQILEGAPLPGRELRWSGQIDF